MPSAATRTGPPEPDHLRNLVVLHVEDDAIIQFHLHAILDRLVSRLHTAADGEEGLAVFRRLRPDVVISDIRMPRLDGLGMVAAIREDDPDMPVIFTSAYSDADYLLRAIELGVDRYLVKPFDQQQVVRAVGRVASGLTRQKQVDEANRFNRFLLDINPNFIVTASGDEIDYVNRTFLSALGHPSLDSFRASGGNIGDLLESVAGHHDRSRLRNWLHEIASSRDENVVVRFRSDNGGQGRAFVVSHNRFPDTDRHVIVFTDVTRLEDERRSLAALAHTDHLTGICNRLRFAEILAQEIERANRYGQPYSLIMLDIDDFKLVNDTHGHEEGDRVLQALAGLVIRHIRTNDVFARWGGEEFMLSAPGCDIEQAGQVAEKIRRLLREAALGPTGGVTCSFGVAAHLPGESPAEMLRRVDQALYAAKQGGKDRIELWPC